jgi:hypothetical protein
MPATEKAGRPGSVLSNSDRPGRQINDIGPARGALEQTMKYLCLVYSEEKKLEGFSDEECVAYDEGLRQGGHCLASEALQPVATATTVRLRNGQLSVTDGPFAETKEQLAGFYLVEARDLNEAIQLAGRIPPVRVGSVEVRPIRELEGRQRDPGTV